MPPLNILDIDDPARLAAEVIRRRLKPRGVPMLAIVGGSGLGGLAHLGEAAGALPYEAIPGLSAAGVAGHENRWLCRRVGEREVYCLLGRRHLYEGIAPVVAGGAMRVLAALGVRQVILTNAAGGLGPGLIPGDLMLITDHLNLMGQDPDRGAPVGAGGAAVYDASMGAGLCRSALEEGLDLKQGIYAGLRGPCYETRAEVAMLRRLGADAVGMSTVPEALVAVRAGLRVAAVSLITNSHCAGLTPPTHEEVLRTAAVSGRRLVRLVRRFILERPAPQGEVES